MKIGFARLAPAIRTMAVALAALLLLSALAKPRIVAAQSSTLPMTISLPYFIAENPADIDLARDIHRTVAADLRRSGSFAVIEWWRSDVRAQARLSGQVARQGDGRVKIEVRLLDNLDNRFLTGQQYLTEVENWRRVAHDVSNYVCERLVGKSCSLETNDQK
ncbi:MAG: hypothetical protein WD073_03610 [Xanthobacteraceae bacterium]